MEIKRIKCEQVDEAVHSNDRAVWLRRYKVDKVKVYRNKDGEVSLETPFTEYVYKVFVLGNALWLKEGQMFSLREALDLLAEQGGEPSIEELEVVNAIEVVRGD